MTARRTSVALALAGLAALLAPACGSTRRPTSAPYVQDVRADEARIALETRAGERLSVSFGRDGGPLDGEAAEAAPATGPHEVRLSGLAPDTLYRYRATGEGGRLLGEATFRTDPGPGARPIAFAAFGDSGAVNEVKFDPLEARYKRLIGHEGHRRGAQADVAARVVERAPDLVIHTGDVIYPEGALEAYADGFFEPFAALIDHVPVYPCLGNHDVKTDAGGPWLEVFHVPESDAGGERFYSFDFGDVHFAALDSETSDLSPDGAQATWLEADLAATGRTWKVVFFHRPPFSDGPHGDAPGIGPGFGPIFAAAGVDLVLSGHDHLYERFYPIDGVTYIVTGGGGADPYPLDPARPGAAHAESVHHFVLVRADAATLAIEAVDLSGRTFDAVTIVK